MGPGDILHDRFRLIRLIGKGGMGVVFQATDLASGELVAVKLLTATGPDNMVRARREAETLSRLSHPAIVRHIADGVLADGTLYLAMAWVDGVTVADRLAHDGFSIREVVVMVRRLADALATAHRANVLHRDIKPSNILLPDGDPARAMLIDFGVARTGTGATLALTRTGAAIGTPGYMSPEQARGERELTAAVDVFGLGCLLYECATGRPAFSGSVAAAVLAKILFADLAPLHVACPEAPPALTTVIARMLAKDRANRLPDGAAVAAALDALGPIPDGPRRSARALVSDVTRVPCADDAMHCLVAAAAGSPEDVLAPPDADQLRALEVAAGPSRAHLELLATGAVIGHFVGDVVDAATRAAAFALAIQKILPGWSIVISSLAADAGVAADQGAALLTTAAMAAIFRKGSRDAITVDPRTARHLAATHELDTKHAGEPRLLGLRRGAG